MQLQLHMSVVLAWRYASRSCPQLQIQNPLCCAAPGAATLAALDAEVRQLEQLLHGPGGGGQGGGGAPRPTRDLVALAAAVDRLAAEIGGDRPPADAASPRTLLARVRALRQVVG